MNPERAQAAQLAADFIRRKANCRIPKRFNVRNGEKIPIGLILGTGWGDALEVETKALIPFREIPGFETLGNLEGHARNVLIGTFAGRQLIILQGRVHLNESPSDPEIYKMVRLQTEMLFALGIKQLIATSAAGSLLRQPHHRPTIDDTPLTVGNVAVIDGFVTAYAPPMPLWAGEFYSPEDSISERLNAIALSYQNTDLKCLPAGYLMVRGPFFEGRKYDKPLFAESGAGVIGMSTLPEACITSMCCGEFLGLSFVTNSDEETHSHQENLRRAKAASEHLGSLLYYVISKI